MTRVLVSRERSRLSDKPQNRPKIGRVIWTGVILIALIWILRLIGVIPGNLALSSSTLLGTFALLIPLFIRLARTSRNTVPWEEMPASFGFRGDWAAAIAIYAAITLFFFWPVITSLNSALIGPSEDNVKYLWNMWWGNQVFTHPGISFAYTDKIFYPEGASLLYNDYSWYNLGLSLVLEKVMSPQAVYNFLVLHTFVLAGLGGFLLARYFTHNSLVSLLGGFIFAFSPSHFAHSLHHINIASIQFIPLFVLFFIKTLKDRNLTNMSMAIFFLLLVALCDWNYLIFCAIFAGVTYLFAAFRNSRAMQRPILVTSATTVGISGIALSPWLVQMGIAGLEHPEANAIGHNIFVADVASLVLPTAHHVASGLPFLQNLSRAITGNPWESAVYLGIANIIILVLAFRYIPKRAYAIIFGGLAFLILALGSQLHIWGHVLPITLPYKLIEITPLLTHARNPSRMIVFVYLALAVAVPIALLHLSNSKKTRLGRIIVPAVLALLVMVDYSTQCKETSSTALPPCYNIIRNDTDRFAILDLPTSWSGNAEYMMYQTYHGKPLVQGLVPRKLGTSLIEHLAFRDMQARKAQLIQNHVKYIVLHKHLLGAGAADAIRYHQRVFKQVYSDESHAVFQVY